MILLGVVPLARLLESQFPPEAVLAIPVKLNEFPLLLAKETACEFGMALPTWNVKFSDCGLTISVTGVLTVNVTGITCGLLLAPTANTVIVPE